MSAQELAGLAHERGRLRDYAWADDETVPVINTQLARAEAQRQQLDDDSEADTDDDGDRRKRRRSRGYGASGPIRCKVIGCPSDLRQSPRTHLRFRLCGNHIRSPVVLVDGTPSRFCQQCSRFHVVEEFEGTNRTCRMMLAKNRVRQRKKRRAMLGIGGALEAGEREREHHRHERDREGDDYGLYSGQLHHGGGGGGRLYSHRRPAYDDEGLDDEGGSGGHQHRGMRPPMGRGAAAGGLQGGPSAHYPPQQEVDNTRRASRPPQQRRRGRREYGDSDYDSGAGETTSEDMTLSGSGGSSPERSRRHRAGGHAKRSRGSGQQQHQQQLEHSGGGGRYVQQQLQLQQGQQLGGDRRQQMLLIQPDDAAYAHVAAGGSTLMGRAGGARPRQQQGYDDPGVAGALDSLQALVAGGGTVWAVSDAPGGAGGGDGGVALRGSALRLGPLSGYSSGVSGRTDQISIVVPGAAGGVSDLGGAGGWGSDMGPQLEALFGERAGRRRRRRRHGGPARLPLPRSLRAPLGPHGRSRCGRWAGSAAVRSGTS